MGHKKTIRRLRAFDQIFGMCKAIMGAELRKAGTPNGGDGSSQCNGNVLSGRIFLD
jgi:hypothetical protein